MTKGSTSRIFVSYSHRGNGQKWKAALLRALDVFEQQALLDVWQDGKIRISSYWDDDIKQAIGSAHLAIVLLTKEALESQYILGVEFPLIRERQQRDKLPVYPVICEPCDWRSHDWLRATQAPNASNPLSELPETTQGGEFRRLATTVAEKLSDVALGTLLADNDVPNRINRETKVFLDKFSLTRTTTRREQRLVGREQELALLDLAFAQPHTSIVSLVAWGGVGKTMLVQHWLERLQRTGWFGSRRVFAWNFHSQGSKEDRQGSEDTFFAHSLEWFGVEYEPRLSAWDKGRLLAEAVTRERSLLILDGIEPLQYPPGPMGGQLRAPGLASLLQHLARKAACAHSAENDSQVEVSGGLCLVTTREPLTDLTQFQRRENSPWGSALQVDLGNLTDEAGAVLLHLVGANRCGAAEIKFDDAELIAATREVNGHALTLNLLGRFLARAHGGDIRRRDLVKFEEADRSEQGGTTFKMLDAFHSWFSRSGEFGARQLTVLWMLGLFDRPADAGSLKALRDPPVIKGLTNALFNKSTALFGLSRRYQPLSDEDWNHLTSFLADFGLVTILRTEDTACAIAELDCHPLVREWAANRLSTRSAKAWRAAHRRLFEFFQREAEWRPNTLHGLNPLYRAVFHGCKAQEMMEAGENVYWERILRGAEHYSWHNLGAFTTELEALACFFNKPWSEPNPVLPEPTRALLLNDTAFCLQSVGRLAEAVEPMRRAIEMRIEQASLLPAAVGSGNLSNLLLKLGHVFEAVREAERAVVLADSSVDTYQSVSFQRMMNRVALADALHQLNRPQSALQHFHDAEQICAERHEILDPLQQSSNSLLMQGFRYYDLLLSRVELFAWKSYLAVKGGEQPELADLTEIIARSDSFFTHVAGMISGASGALPLHESLTELTLARALLYAVPIYASIAARTAEVHGAETCKEHSDHCRSDARLHISSAVDGLRRSGHQDELPYGLLTRAWLGSMEKRIGEAQTDLDDAWDIAERGLMRLHMADVHLFRARLFFREKNYPWKSPANDLAAAEKLINECGYHRRDEDLADAKVVILGKGP